MNQKSFILFTSWYEPLRNLSIEDKGMLFDAIFQYHLTGIIPELSPVASMAFSFMKSGFEQNSMKYEAITERNRNNGIKGGRPKKNPENPVGILETQRNPKNLKYDNDSDNDNDYDILLKKENKGWREDFAIYLELVNEFFRLAFNNKEFIKKQEIFAPAVDAKLTIQKAYDRYWSQRRAWNNQKKKSDEPDWRNDIVRSFDFKSNIVYRARNEDERSRQPIRY